MRTCGARILDSALAPPETVETGCNPLADPPEPRPPRQRSAHKLVQVQLTTDIPSLGSRGSIVITSPGRARNQLVPSGLALYVGRDGKPVSAARDMNAKATERMQGYLMGGSKARRDSERDRRAKAVLEGLAGGVVRPRCCGHSF